MGEGTTRRGTATPVCNTGDVVKWVLFLGQEDPLAEEMTTCSSVLAWRIPGTAEPGGLPSMGSHGVGHD